MSRADLAPDRIDQAALEWFTRSMAGDMTAAEAARLDAWLDADPAHRAAFDEVSFTWQGIEPLRADPRIVAMQAGRPRRRWLPQAIAASLVSLGSPANRVSLMILIVVAVASAAMSRTPGDQSSILADAAEAKAGIDESTAAGAKLAATIRLCSRHNEPSELSRP